MKKELKKYSLCVGGRMGAKYREEAER